MGGEILRFAQNDMWGERKAPFSPQTKEEGLGFTSQALFETP